MKIKRIIFYIFLLLVLLIGLSFAALNADPVTIHYYIGVRDIPLSLLLVYALAAGIFLALLIMMKSLLALKRENRLLNKAIKKANALLSASDHPATLSE